MICVALQAGSVVYGAVAGIVVAGARRIDSYSIARNSSICWSARTAAVVIRLALLSVMIPALNEATIARIPMFRITIAISSSIRPKPWSARAAASAQQPYRQRPRGPLSDVPQDIRRAVRGVHQRDRLSALLQRDRRRAVRIAAADDADLAVPFLRT